MNTITQVEFLDALAYGAPQSVALLVAKTVHPKGVDSKGLPRAPVFPAEVWGGKPLPEGKAWYFCCGGVSVAPNAKPRRTMESITHVRAFVIDDVGTKVDASRIKLQPTWKIETSPGNFQWGYLLNWTDDIAGHNALNKALVKAKLQDPGAQGVNRLSRVPGSVNLKPAHGGWVALLDYFFKSVVFTLDGLAYGLGVELVREKDDPASRKAERPSLGSKNRPDPIHSWLKSCGRVHGSKGGGWLEIDCFWPEEHSNDPRLTCDYKPWSADDGGYRGLRCHHSHGEDEVAFRKRFFAEVAERTKGEKNAEQYERGGEPFKRDQVAFNEMQAALATKLHLPAVVEALQPPPPFTGEPFNFRTLRRALGDLDISKMPLVDMGEKKPSRIQPVTYENVEAGLAHLGVQARLNLMTAETDFVLPDTIDKQGFGTKGHREIMQMTEAALIDCFYRSGYRNKKDVRDCFARIANGNYWHPMRDWITSRPWDGKDRLELLAGSVITPTPQTFRTLFRRWLLQTIEATCGWEKRRESQKGLVFVLVGDQGIGKTRWLMSLAPGFGAEGKHLNLGGNGAGRDSKHEVLQAAIVELGELEATFKKSDIAALKAFITAMTDEYRLPYAADWLRRPRCTSLCGSVNEGEFLNDPTGGRRFLPLTVSRCYPEHGVDMQQLWAQVHSYWGAGEQWWLTDAETTLRIEHSVTFEQTDGVAEHIDDEVRLRSEDSRFTIECGLGTGAIMRLLGLPHTHPLYQARASTAMHKYGTPRDLRHRGGGKRAWVWRVSADEMRQFNLSPLKPVKA